MTTRRDFLKTSAAAAVATTLPNLAVHAGGSDVIKVGIIGCGGRGSGAGVNVLEAAKGVEIVALGDFFRADGDRGVEPCRQKLLKAVADEPKIKELGNKVDVPPERCYSGLDAYQKVIATPGVNYVILASSPGFRPMHLQAAVEAGKHIFTEKPVAVDGPGIRLCFELYEQAQKKNLCIAAGTQRRHQAPYIETVKALQDGAIGDIVAARAYWNGGAIWFRRRRPEHKTDLEYQMHNWYHFAWLCGDHIVEQHVHNLDVINWITNSHPVRCLGMGGRVLPCSDPNVDGHIFTFFAIEYEYPNGMRMQSMCRQVNNTEGNLQGLGGVSEAVVGSKGTCYTTDGRHQNNYQINGKPAVSRELVRGFNNPYVQEHTDLIDSIRNGKRLNELKSVTESTLTAIMGRMSAYTGKSVTWERALGSTQKLMPENLTAGSLQMSPVPVPGRTELV